MILTIRPLLVASHCPEGGIVLSPRAYVETIAVAYLAAPDGSDEEGELHVVLSMACARYGIDRDGVVIDVIAAAGEVRLGEDPFQRAPEADRG